MSPLAITSTLAGSKIGCLSFSNVGSGKDAGEGGTSRQERSEPYHDGSKKSKCKVIGDLGELSMLPEVVALRIS